MRRSSIVSGACWAQAHSRLALLCALTLACASLLNAQYARPRMTQGVSFEQKLNAQIPLDLAFRDETGRSIPLGAYFSGGKPVVLGLVYYKCPNICGMTLSEMVSGLHRLSFEPGRDYSVVVVSFDPSETSDLAAKKKAGYAKMFGRPSYYTGWHFLTGDEASIKKLADAVGFHYRWDPQTKQWVHAAGIVVVTPDGKISRYFYGLQYLAADLRLALVTASQDRIGSPVDYILLFCCHWDPTTGKYTVTILNVLKLGAALTLLMLGTLIFLLMRHGKHNRKVQHVL